MTRAYHHDSIEQAQDALHVPAGADWRERQITRETTMSETNQKHVEDPTEGLMRTIAEIDARHASIPTLQPAGFNPQPGPQAEFMARPVEELFGDPTIEASAPPVVPPEVETPPADDVPPASILVETHAQAAEINANRTAEQGYVKVGDVVPA